MERERYPIPTIEEVRQDLDKGKVFSKLNLKWGYHQIELTGVSRNITTFITHTVLFRYKRLMFGISSVPEKYQQVVQQVLQGLDGCHNISDDSIVHGETQDEHDGRLREVLRRLSVHGLTLNKEKCQFSMSELTPMGHVLSEKGVSVEDDEVRAVAEFREPKNASEDRSFLGLVNFSARFILHLSTLSKPLRKLNFEWGVKQAQAFKALET